MKIFKKSSLVIAIAAAIALTGCTGAQTMTGSKMGDDGLIGGGVGAGLGAAIGQVAGLNPLLGALAGGVIGAAGGAYYGHTKDVEIAEANAQKWSQQGFQTQVVQSAVPTQQGQQTQVGQSQQQKLDRVDIDIPKKMLKGKSASMASFLHEVGSMASNSNVNYAGTIYTDSEANYRYMLSEISKGAVPKNIAMTWIKSDQSKLVMEVLPA